MADMIPGVHRVRRNLAGGRVAEHWYAWRGGPSILTAAADSDALLAREVARLAPSAAAAYEARRRPADHATLYGLITRYLSPTREEPDRPPPHLRSKAPRTIADRRKLLDRVRGELGTMELRALESPRARAVLLQWRAKRAATPKTADDLLGALSTVIQWAVDNGELKANPVASFERLYSCNRADAIWEPQHLAALLPHAAPELAQAVELAIHTGLRVSDLIALPRQTVGRDAIVWQTGKSRGRRTIVVPITDACRRALDAIPARDATTVLTSSRRRPWSLAGIESALQRAKAAAQAEAERVGGPEAKSGIGHLRWHDLRGTACTHFVRAGLSLEDIALILGWTLDRVEQMAARYVTGQEIGLAIVERMKRNKAGTEAVNGPVNGGRSRASKGAES